MNKISSRFKQTMKRLLMVTSILPLFLMVFSTASWAEEGNARNERSEVPDFTLQTLNGDRISLSDLEGEIVVISFWATWCVPCLEELPYIEAFQREYGEQGVEVLAISTDGPETMSQVRSVVRRNRWTMNILLDQDSAVSSLLNPHNATPYTMIVDRQGRLAYDHEGYTAGVEVEYREQLERILAEPGE
jgi:peroxiredoxin